MRAKRVDANHGELIRAFRQMGCTVFDTSMVGNGFPDIVLCRNGENILIEIKSHNKAILTDKEKQFFKTWRGKAFIVRSLKEAADLITELDKHAKLS